MNARLPSNHSMTGLDVVLIHEQGGGRQGGTLMSVRDSSSGPSVAFYYLSELEHAQQASGGASQLKGVDHQPDAPLTARPFVMP